MPGDVFLWEGRKEGITCEFPKCLGMFSRGKEQGRKELLVRSPNPWGCFLVGNKEGRKEGRNYL
jgi:hypothetical protein